MKIASVLFRIALVLAASPVAAQPSDSAEPTGPRYDLRFEMRIVPSQKTAHVAIHVADPARAVWELRFRTDPERQLSFRGDGVVLEEEQGEPVDGDPLFVTWKLPRGGGVLRYSVRIDHLRDESSYDARCTRDFALIRADDLVPPVRVDSAPGSQSDSRLQLVLPAGWSAVVPYRPLGANTWAVERPERKFDRPVGWLLMGRLGVLRERVAGSRIALGAPVGQGMRRMDMLALLRWTLPALRKVAPLPERIAIVGAGDPMWRGGLSAPGSAYLHTSLPLISSDGTSPLLHEVIHVMLRARAGRGGDWVVEGLSELYSLEALLRSKTISKKRYARAIARIEERARTVRRVTVERSTGAVTARAVVLLRELDREIRRLSEDQRSLDDVVRALAESREPITLAHFRAVSENVAGQGLAGFFDRRELRLAAN